MSSLILIGVWLTPGILFDIPSYLDSFTLSVRVIFIFAIFPSVIEELLYRHYGQRVILNGFSETVRVWVTAVPFTLMHLHVYSVTVNGIATVSSLFPYALALGYIRERTGSIWYCMFLHSLANFGTLLVIVAGRRFFLL